MRLKHLLITALTCVSLYGSATDYENYTSLKSEGNLPEVFLQSATEEFEKKVGDIDKKHKHYEKVAEKEFHMYASFAIHDVLYNGKILFGDPITDYLNDIADVILKDQPKLRKEINIFAFKSSQVNALCFPNGVILINIGLLTQLEDESQLALIIGHEITHYIEQHSLDHRIEGEKMERGKGEYRGADDDKLEVEYYSHSREQEIEADLEGLKLLKNTKYDLSGVEDVFNVLKYSYLPYDELSLENTYFESEGMRLPNKFVLEEKNTIDFDDEEEDDNSTHPSAEKRKEEVLEKMIDFDNSGRSKYIISQERFNETQKLARFELVHIYLMTLNYEKAFYNAYLNLQHYPEKKFNEMAMAKSFYGLAKYANADRFFRVKEQYEDAHGEWQQFFFLVNEMSAKEISVMATRLCYMMEKKYEDDVTIKKINQDLINELVIVHEIDLADFKTKAPKRDESDFVELTDQEYQKLTKMEKIKYKKKLENVNGEGQFWEYAFLEFVKDDAIKEYFKKADEAEKEANKGELTKAEKSKKKKEAKREARKGKCLGIDKVLVVNPEYKKRYSNKDEKNYKAVEKDEHDYNDHVSDVAERAGLEAKIIDDFAMSETSTEDYNTYCLLNRFLVERIAHYTFDVNMVNIFKEDISPIANTYDTKYFVFTGIATRKIHVQGKGWYLLGGLYFWPILPLAIYKMAAPDYATMHYYLLFDFETGEPVWAYSKDIQDKDYNSLLDATLFDVFYQTARKKY